MSRRNQIAIHVAVIVLISAVVYFPSLKNGFTDWDDKVLVRENEDIRGLTIDHLARMFSASFGGFGGYTPLVFLSYAVEYRFFELDPRAYHATNLLLHILNSLLVYGLIYLVGGSRRLGFIVAAFFAIHPLPVEAVAWIPGRKDLLFSFFFLAALISYISSVKKRRRRGLYILALLLFAFSALSKAAAVSFPLVMFLVDFHFRKKLDKSSFARAVPFILVSLGILFLAVVTDSPSLPQASVEKAGYFQNLGLFFYSFAFYIGKFFLPINLIARYSIEIGRAPWHIALNVGVFVLFCGFLVWMFRRRAEIAAFGTAFFVLTLLPTLPFHFFGQPYADRYMYLPLIGLLFIIASALEPFLSAKAGPRSKGAVLVSLLVLAAAVGLGWQTYHLCGVWRDGLSLWTYVLEKDPANATAYLNRGDALIGANRLEEAMSDFEQAARFNPNDPHAYTNMGFIHFKKGVYDRALEEYNRALTLNPAYDVGYLNRGILWGRLGEFEKAVQDFTAVLRLNPDSAAALYYRGLAYQELNMTGPALKDLQEAHRLNPTDRTLNQIEIIKRMEK